MQSLDRFFAQRILKQDHTPERELFLATLMQVSRQGHLCWKTMETLDWILPKDGPVVRDGDRYYLQRNWAYETLILEQVQRLRSLPPPSFHDGERFSKGLEQAQLLPLQKTAIETAFQSRFSLICGGPGTGRSHSTDRKSGNESPRSHWRIGWPS
jgi:ATP-dependent exoDNAse (exonuclease V) alpha subunit